MCIDMLNSVISARPYEGWSTAYSLSGILLQLQNFLFDSHVHDMSDRWKNTLWDRVLEEGGERRPASEVREKLLRAQRECMNFYCAGCGFSGKNATNDPELMCSEAGTNGVTLSSSSGTRVNANGAYCILAKTLGGGVSAQMRVPGVYLANDRVDVFLMVKAEAVEGDDGAAEEQLWQRIPLKVKAGDDAKTDTVRFTLLHTVKDSE